MGFREFFRGTTAADDEARAPAPENELPLLGGVHRVERHMTGGGSTPPRGSSNDRLVALCRWGASRNDPAGA
jgi:hypothetical protein